MMLSPKQQRSWRTARLLAAAVPKEKSLKTTLNFLVKRNFHVMTQRNSSFHQQHQIISVAILPQHRNQSASTKATAAMSVSELDQESNDDAPLASTNTDLIKNNNAKISTFGAYSDLAKAKLSALVVSTAAIGFVAAGGPLSCPWTLTSCCVGTALLSSSAAAWNQILEIDRDQRMKRTQLRPLVQGTIPLAHAQVAAVTWGVAGTSMLVYGTNPITATLGVANVALYAGLYTYMKPRSIYNTWVGAVVGAIPPLMGWTAAANLIPMTTTTTAEEATTAVVALIDPGMITATGAAAADWINSLNTLAQQLQHVLPMEAWWLAGVLYLWQMPHFLALSHMHRIDYRRGGFQMVSTVYPPDMSARLITRYAWYLTAMPFVATSLLETTSSMFAMEGILLNAYALRAAYKFQYDQSNANARHVFLTSLWYLPSLLMLYLLHSKVWDQEPVMMTNDETTPLVHDSLREYLSDWIHQIRSKGREVCVHEQAAIKAKNSVTATISESNNNSSESYHQTPIHPPQRLACPVVVGKQVGHSSVEVATNAGKEVVAAAAASSVATNTTSLEGSVGNTGSGKGGSVNR
jgi:protoheme IX farnesyltransferase